MNVLTFLISLFGGGILGALINWIGAERARQKERKISFLDKQIRELYGPLYYFISHAEKLFELNNKFHEAYKIEYIDKEYSDNEYTQNVIDKETNETLNIANKYVGIVKSNNEKIKVVLDSSYSLIDPEDIEIFLMFFEHHIRLNTERNKDGKLSTPRRIYKHIGDISFLHPEIIKRVKEKFFSKKSELQKLVEKSFWP